MNLFDKLPSTIFRPLAAENRRVYAALLLHLHENAFSTIGHTPRESEVLQEIGDFIERHTVETYDPEADKTPGGAAAPGTGGADGADDRRVRGVVLAAPKGQDTRRYLVYATLRETGWLIVIRDRFRKLVDLSPEARLLLRELQKIARGDTRSYGGAVLAVLGNLEQAIGYPEERSEGISNAYRFSHDFMQHLRTLSGEMRRVEERILGQENLRDFFKAFFKDYIAERLISDYKTLHTKNNPFRFRGRIIDAVRHIEGDPLLRARLAGAYVKENRAANEAEAEQTILNELADIYRVFDSIDRSLDIIDETQARIERRVHTVIRYMDRDDRSLLDRATQALRALGACKEMALDDVVPLNTGLLAFEKPWGEDSLYLRRQQREAPGRSRLRQTEPDPAVIAFEMAKEAYSRRITVNPERVREFLERVMGERTEMRASDIPVETVDDFIVFQRLRETDVMFDGYLARHYRVERLPLRVSNEWLDFNDFVIHRVPAADKRQADERRRAGDRR